MTRTCPRCHTSGPPHAFPLVPPCHAPPRHDEMRRRCVNCGHEAAAWTFARSAPKETIR